jgi:hypothetical protein
VRLNGRSSIAEDAVGTGHFKQRDFRRAKRQRRLFAQIAFDPEALRDGDRTPAPYTLVEAHGDGIDRLRQRRRFSSPYWLLLLRYAQPLMFTAS